MSFDFSGTWYCVLVRQDTGKFMNIAFPTALILVLI